MNKKGSVLVFGLIVVLVLSILSSSYLAKVINQGLQTRRYADSTQALWLAEAGIHEARDNNLFYGSLGPDDLGRGSYEVEIGQIGMSNYYYVVSTGTVGSVSRTVEAVVSTRDVDPTKFKYGLESTVDIDFKGSAQVYGENTPLPIPAKTRDPEYYLPNSTFSFADLFCFTTAEIKAISTVYTGSWPSGDISGINWVIAPSSNFNGNVTGSGILIVEGDLRVTGTIDFDGIIYVIGELRMAGTANIQGSVLAESAATVDTTLTGTCDIEHSYEKIASALDIIKYRSPQIVSWKELPEG